MSPSATQADDPKVVTAKEELERVLPVVQKLKRSRPKAIVSIDTYKANVARAAIEAGAEIVNDVSAFRWDPKMAKTVAELKCGAVLMHMRGRPEEWRTLEPVADIVVLVKRELREWSDAALLAGVKRERMVLDPGFGFGKNFEQNYPLLRRFEELHQLRYPLLAGVSRKSFVGRMLARNGTRRCRSRSAVRHPRGRNRGDSQRRAHHPNARRSRLCRCCARCRRHGLTWREKFDADERIVSPPRRICVAATRHRFLSSAKMDALLALKNNPRVTVRRDGVPDPDGTCVVYWMQRAQRGIDNPALDTAVEAANALGKPVVVFFAPRPFPPANLRHYAFLAQGIPDIAEALGKAQDRLRPASLSRP